MRAVIGILTKATYPEWRIGPERAQDWYRQCVGAVKLSRETGQEILTTSCFTSESGVSDEDEYVRVVTSFGSPITRLSQGVDTEGQLTAMVEYASKKSSHLIVVVTLLHYPRVLWLSRRKKLDVSFLVTFGIPRPREAVTDIALMVLYPLLDLVGLGDRLTKWNESRRLRGKF